MIRIITIISLLTVLLFALSAMAQTKVVVIPLNKAGVKLNQRCPGESPMIGIDKNGNIICGTKIVFVSSVVYNGNLGSLQGADIKCNTLAAEAGLPGTYKAWLSDGRESPSTRFSKSYWSYVLTNGNVIANGWDNLVNGKLMNPINVDENGEIRPDNYAWTGTWDNGTSAFADCSNWQSTLSFGVLGRIINIVEGWTIWDDQPCDNLNHIYCFEQ